MKKIIFISIILFVSSACALLPATATPGPFVFPTSTPGGETATTAPSPTAPTQTPMVVTATATSQPPAAEAPTDEPTLTPPPPTGEAPTQLPPPSGTRISFPPGGTSGYVEGDAAAGETVNYVVGAAAGQKMLLNLDTPGSDAILTVTGPDGKYLVPPASKFAWWRGTLRSNGDYILQVIMATASHYSLSVVIPARIQFAPGAVSATLKGEVQASSAVTYLAQASKGQTMSVKITSPNSDVLLTIYGLEDGSPLVRYVSGASSWNGKLPMTQDYVIEARSVGAATGYTITVAIK